MTYWCYDRDGWGRHPGESVAIDAGGPSLAATLYVEQHVLAESDPGDRPVHVRCRVAGETWCFVAHCRKEWYIRVEAE